jgi:hypothetical protein
MKRIILAITLVAAAAWILAIPAAAQGQRGQGHPGGGSAAGGSMGASDTHGNSATAGGGHGSSNAMASTDPGSVLEHNSNLSGKLETLTGATSVADLKTDASAFKNFGQFVAAAHVAKNLNINGGFAALMCDMTTKTATGATATCTNTTKMSLGKAIQTLDPQADSKSESKKAMNQASQDLKDSSGS